MDGIAFNRQEGVAFQIIGGGAFQLDCHKNGPKQPMNKIMY